MAFDVKVMTDNTSPWGGEEEGTIPLPPKLTCQICSTQINTDTELKRETPTNFYFPGSQGSILLNGHLRTYFIVRKLLKLPEHQFFHLIRNGDGGNDNGGIGGKGFWPFVTEFCGRCEIIVNEAVDLHAKMVDLQRQVDLLGERLSGFWKEAHGPIQLEFSAIASAVTSNNFTPAIKVDTKPNIKPKRTARKSTRIINYHDDDKQNQDSDSDYIPNDFEEDVSDEDYIMESDTKKESVTKKLATTSTETEYYNEASSEPDEDSDEPEVSNDHEDEVVVDKDPILSAVDPALIKARIPKNVAGDGNSTQSIPKFRFQCTECSMIFSSRSCLHAHTKKSHGFEVMYPCPKCPHLKFTRMKLREHRRKVHDKETTCDKCGRKLCSRRTLLQHFRLVHKMKVTFNCSLCPKKFTKKFQLIAHKKEHVVDKTVLQKLPQREPENEEERMWADNPCQYCGKIFLSGTTFLFHLTDTHALKINKDDRSFDKKVKCYFCHLSFVLEQARWVHCKKDHPEIPLEFPCEKCTEEGEKVTFQTTSELETHLQIVHEMEDGMIHKCIKCGWPFLNEETLNAHRENHINRKPDPNDPNSKQATYSYKCWFCWEKYPTEEARQNHFATNRRHRNTKLEFPCELESCPNHTQPFQNVAELNVHLSKCHGEGGGEDVIHQCPECSWGFLSKEQLTLHTLNHIHRRRSNMQCPACDHVCRKLSILKNHYNNAHGLNLEMHKCPYCPMRFANTKSLSKHMAARHKEMLFQERVSSSGLPCDQCGHIFKDKSTLRQHLNSQHVPTKCPDCDVEFPNKTRWLRHWQKVHRVVAPEQQHLCPECGKACPGKSELSRHMKIHGEKKHKCHICEFKSVSSGALKFHLKKVHEEKANRPPPPPPKFPCPHCEKGYARKDSLDDHVRCEHSTDVHRIWSCDKCGKRFNRQGCLTQHLRGKGCSKKWS